MKTVLRILPLLVIVIILVGLFYSGANRYFSFEALKAHHDALLMWRDQNYMEVVLIFMLVYIGATAISFPGATILTLLGGFLFGVVWGTVYIVIAATIGATLLFLAVKTALGSYFAKKAAGRIKKMEEGFRQDAFYYLL